MTHKERFFASLNRERPDRLPYGDSLWPETHARYEREGRMRSQEDSVAHFDMSWRGSGWFQSVADLDFTPVIVHEDEGSVTKLDGNGAQLRYWKAASGTPEHVDFAVQDRAAWESRIKPFLLTPDPRRFDQPLYATTRQRAADEDRAFVWHGVAPFELMHPVCGHEHMLMGMALDPDWIKDMVMTFADFTIAHLELLFQSGLPDAFWFYEDMGFKERPFMSPAMYEDIVMPGHVKLFDYAHSKGCKVIVHSCGFVEPLVPGLIKAGMDCLQAMEVKAGMDMPRLVKAFGDKITFCGNIDIRVLAANDRPGIDAELRRKILPVLEAGSGYIAHSDHSIPPEVDHDTLVYFFEKAASLIAKA